MLKKKRLGANARSELGRFNGEVLQKNYKAHMRVET
jgi:hypothetical protein